MNTRTFLWKMLSVLSLAAFMLAIGGPVQAGPTWIIKTVDSVGDVGTWTTLRVTPGGVPFISYGSGEMGQNPRYAVYSLHQWMILPIPGCQGASAPGMDLDSQAVAHFTCLKINATSQIVRASFQYDLVYSNSEGNFENAYHYEDRCTTKNSLYGSIISIAADGKPDIKHAFSRSPIGVNDLCVAGKSNNPGGQFQTTRVERVARWETTKIGKGEAYWDEHYDVHGHLQAVAYTLEVQGDSQILYSSELGNEVLDIGSDAGLDMDANGNPHISYSKGGVLWYAYEVAPKMWNYERVGPIIVESLAQYTDLVVDSGGWPHISYYDGFHGNLMYAHKDGAGWHTMIVDSVGDVGKWTSIAVDRWGVVHIAYYDATNGGLKYARYIPPTSN